MQSNIATTEHNGKRLDVVLADMLKISRAQAQKMIASEQVLLNGKKSKAHEILRAEDVVSVKKTTEQKNKKVKITLPKLNIIAETDDYLVVNKPAGIIVHGGNGIDEPTLTDALEKKYPAIQKIGDDPLRPGIVHRLDKDASGLMVIAKTQAMFDHLKEQFQKRTVTKKYLALVYGATAKEYDEMTFAIARSAQGYKMAAKPHNQDGRHAVTTFHVKQKFTNYTLLDVTIKTGRTHQIRVHLAAYGHPVVGDDLYGAKKTILQNKKINLGRIFLHAYELGFADLQNKPQQFTIELPDELQNFLNTIYGK